MKIISFSIAITLLVVNFYLAFNVGVQVGNAQTHTIQTIILPSINDSPRTPIVPPTVPKKGHLHNMSYTFSAEDEKCLALNIYWEARNQDLKGKLAIGLVTIQRVTNKHYPNTVCEVVWFKAKDRRTGKMVAHFSWTLDGKSDIPEEKKAWEEAKLLASAFAGDGATINDFTNGAYLYHADYVDPYWRPHYNKVAQFGTHHFYK